MIFEELEADLQIKIPYHLKNLLIFCGYDSYVALADFDAGDICVLEKIAREQAWLCNLLDIYGPLCTDQKCFVIQKPHQQILIAIGKYASNKVKNFTSTNFGYR